MRVRGTYVGHHGMIFAGQFHFADIRGWGALIGCGGRQLPEKEAAAIMRENEEFTVAALNAADTGLSLTRGEVQTLRTALKTAKEMALGGRCPDAAFFDCVLVLLASKDD